MALRRTDGPQTLARAAQLDRLGPKAKEVAGGERLLDGPTAVGIGKQVLADGKIDVGEVDGLKDLVETVKAQSLGDFAGESYLAAFLDKSQDALRAADKQAGSGTA